jgi:DnaD/phage-associated family protein
MLKKNYVFKVAESWNKGGVKTFDELEDYQNKQTKLNNVMQKMKSKLRLNRSFTEYEEAFIASWINEFKYDFDIVDFAIQKTSSKGAPTIGYINGILKNWHESGLSTLNDIMQKEENKVVPRQRVTVGVSNNLNHKNYEQRKDIDLNEFYDT